MPKSATKTSKTKGNGPGKPSKLPLPRRKPAPDTFNPGKPAAPKSKPANPAKPDAGTTHANATAAEPEVAATVTAALPPTATTAAAGKRSCLDAAAEVLRADGRRMRVRELVAAMRDRGLWQSDARTPHQTLAGALLREITRKGPASRFRKADRGRFALAAHPA
jgi:hypothetical protein